MNKVSWTTRIGSILLAITASAGATAAEPLDVYDELLARYVTPSGVRYAAWRAEAGDVARLDSVVEALSATDPASLSPAARHALYINLYNARTLKLILDENPPDSIRDLSRRMFGFGVFYRELLEFDGETISLDDLEDRLREESRDPRVHFAVNCASRSCPPLAAEAFRGAALDEQLDEATRRFLALPGALIVEERLSGNVTLRVSKIFDWFEGDFEPTGGVLAFIRQYAPPEVAAKLGSGRVKLAHQKYDWSLNSSD